MMKTVKRLLHNIFIAVGFGTMVYPYAAFG